MMMMMMMMMMKKFVVVKFNGRFVPHEVQQCTSALCDNSGKLACGLWGILCSK